ncbi:MAG: FmdB family zinc ribbon protein [Candidatus Limnocylindria bacterium]
MPTYDYECRSCGDRIEVIHGMTEPGPTACERCGGPMRRRLYATGIIFKGSGFYKTDSRREGSAASTGPTDPSEKPKTPDKPAGASAGATTPAPASGDTT